MTTTNTMDAATLRQLALQLRRDSLRMVYSAGSGHPGGAMGAAEVLAVLYGAVMRHAPVPTEVVAQLNRALGHEAAGADPTATSTAATSGIPASAPQKPVAVNRDRFILSNGHICAVWYAALSHFGYLSRAELTTHRKLDSRLQGHPSRRKWPEVVETSTGPLGQGLSVANGIALGQRLSGDSGRVFCIMGDGELQEGQVWEAAMTAAHRKLSTIRLIVLFNDVQIDGPVSAVKAVAPIAEKFRAFGWNAIDVDGHDVEALIAAFAAADECADKPSVLVARTVMAKGVAFMEHDPHWHGGCPSAKQLETALAELGSAEGFSDYQSNGQGNGQ